MFGKRESKEPTDKQKIGKIGEDCACKYLENAGYKIIDRNYLKKWGEIDIVAKKGKKIHFIEVKSVSRVISDNVIRETDINRVVDHVDAILGGKGNGLGGVQKYDEKNIFLSNNEMRQMGNYRPEDNMHPWKLQRLGRAIQSYLLDKDIPDDVDWQFDVATVYIDVSNRVSKVFLLEDVVL